MLSARLIRVFLLLVLANLVITVQAQKAIQLEKRGSLKTEKYFVGELLIYKLKSDKKIWLEEYMRDISIEDGFIFFEHQPDINQQYQAHHHHNANKANQHCDPTD